MSLLSAMICWQVHKIMSVSILTRNFCYIFTTTQIKKKTNEKHQNLLNAQQNFTFAELLDKYATKNH